MHKLRFRIGGSIVLASLLAITAAGSAAAHVVVTVGSYSLAIGWAHEPTYVGQENAVQVIVTDASGAPVDDLSADALTVVVSTGGQQSAPLALEPKYDADTGLGIHGDYEASIMPTAAGDYTFHVTGSIHGTSVDETETSSDSTFNSATDASGIQFPDKLPTMAEVVTRLDRIDARASAAPGGVTQASVDAAASAASDAGDAANRALLVGGGLGLAGLIVGALGLIVALRRNRSTAA
jgi:hypothetical protein